MTKLILAIALGLFTVSLATAQTTKRIKLAPCGNGVTVVGNLTKRSKGFLYLVKLMKGYRLQFNLSAKPDYKEVYVNLYHDNDSYGAKNPMLQGEIGKDYEFVVEETGDYSIMVFANRKTTKFSLVADISDKGWKC